MDTLVFVFRDLSDFSRSGDSDLLRGSAFLYALQHGILRWSEAEWYNDVKALMARISDVYMLYGW